MSEYFITADALRSKQTVIDVHLCRPDGLDAVLETLTDVQQATVAAHGFSGGSGQIVLVPDAKGRTACVLFGTGEVNDGYSDSALQVGILSEKLEAGIYVVKSAPADWDKSLIAAAWGLGAYRFDRYLGESKPRPTLVLDGDMRPSETVALVRATHLGRDLINTPASDMGPADLEAACRHLAKVHGAKIDVITGKALIDQNFPMIHAVGRAAAQDPRLVDMRWGTSGPKLTLVGKGVCFDTGGLNLKPGASMGLMKKGSER